MKIRKRNIHRKTMFSCFRGNFFLTNVNFEALEKGKGKGEDVSLILKEKPKEKKKQKSI